MKTLLNQFFKKKRKITANQEFQKYQARGSFVPGKSWSRHIEEKNNKIKIGSPNPPRIAKPMPSFIKNKQKEFNEALQKSKNGKERLEYNLEILELLKNFAEQNPELRFTQILSICFEETCFYEEPKDTLEKIKQNLKYNI